MRGVHVREVASIVVEADRESVYRALLPAGGLVPDGLVASVPNERLEVRAGGEDARAARRWFLLRDEGAGTRVIHGVVAGAGGLRERLRPFASREALRAGLDAELSALKLRLEGAPRDDDAA